MKLYAWRTPITQRRRERGVSCSQQFLGGHLLDQEVATSSGEREFPALTLCAARLIFTRKLVDGFGFPTWKDRQPTRTPQQRGVLPIAKALGSSSLFRARVFGYGRLGHQVFERGESEAADWDACPRANMEEGLSEWWTGGVRRMSGDAGVDRASREWGTMPSQYRLRRLL